MTIISAERKGTWNLDDVYRRIGADCWRYSALDSGDTLLYYMGRGNEGQFANNDANICDGYPRQIRGNNWGSLCNAATYRGIVNRKCDGTVWVWGNNDYGKLGDGGQGYRSSPVQIDGCWTMVTAGHQNVSGIKTDGSYWNWGYGNHGQLGLFCASPCFPYTNENCSVMMRVGLANNWCYSHSGYHSNYGIKTDNTLWAWGYNGHGELAVNNTTCYSSPVQIPGTWCEVRGTYPVVGKRADGSHSIWGHNNHGQLGDNTTANRSSPIVLPGTWIHLSSDNSNSSLMMAGIKNDNTLWTWGYNGHGELGDCTTNPRSSPVQIPGSWRYVATGHRHTVAIKTDGTLWGWGHNTDEQRYHCSGNIDRSSPIQLPGSNWLDIGTSYDGTYIRKCGIPITQET